VKRAQFYSEAERLYVQEQRTFEDIAKQLDVAERTLRNWAEDGKWQARREQYVAMQTSTHEDMHTLVRGLLRLANKDIADQKPPSQSVLYTISKIAPLLDRVKKYEDSVVPETTTARGLSADIIAAIESEVLGIKRNNEQSTITNEAPH